MAQGRPGGDNERKERVRDNVEPRPGSQSSTGRLVTDKASAVSFRRIPSTDGERGSKSGERWTTISEGKRMGSRTSRRSHSLTGRRSRSRSGGAMEGTFMGSSRTRRAEVAVNDALQWIPEVCGPQGMHLRAASYKIDQSATGNTIKSLRDLQLPTSTRPEVRDQLRVRGTFESLLQLSCITNKDDIVILCLQLLSRAATDRYRVPSRIQAYRNEENQRYFVQECQGLLRLKELFSNENDKIRGTACALAADVLFENEENQEAAFAAGPAHSTHAFLLSVHTCILSFALNTHKYFFLRSVHKCILSPAL